MRILMVASEATPFAKTGGLADVARRPSTCALAARPCRRPGFAEISWCDGRGVDRPRHMFRSENMARTPACSPTARRHSDGVCRPPAYFDRDQLVRRPASSDYPDNPERFAFLSRAALEWAATSPGAVRRRSTCTTGRSALVPVFLNQGVAPGASASAGHLHDPQLGVPGNGRSELAPGLGLALDLMHLDALEYWGRISLLKGGVVFSRDHDRQPSVCQRNSNP